MSLAARLIRVEGCAAVTARRLAEELGLKRQIVHYYFGTIEDLFIAVIRRSIGKVHERVRQQFESDQPLKVIVELGNMATSSLFEYTAMAMRSKAIKAEMQHYMDEFRRIQTQAILRNLERRGIVPSIPAGATAFIINCVAHTLAVEEALGVSEGHQETRALLDEWLRAYAQTGEWTQREKPVRPKGRLVALQRE